MNGWLVFGLLLAAYLGLYFVLRGRKGPLPGGFEFAGPLLLWRTNWGKDTIQRVARPGRFWNVVADVGIVVTWIVGFLIFALLVLSLFTWVLRPAESAENAPGVRELLGLPGINPMIPLGYGIVALILALVIHEGSHGVMAYVAKMRVKSLGLVMFIVPVGAFVEPHDEDMMKATTRAKNRVFAAGPTSNIVLALVAGMLLSTLFVGQMDVRNDGDGVVVGAVEPGSAAALAGLEPGDLMTLIDGQRITTREQYTSLMANTSAGQRIDIVYLRDGAMRTTTAVLGDRHEYIARVAPSQNEDANRGKGFLGVSGLGLQGLDGVREALAHPFADLSSFFFYISYPFFIFTQGLDVMAAPYTDLFEITGPMAFMPPWLFFATASLLYWIMWLNLMLGTFNALPAGPLDGGQMLRATLSERMMRRYRVDRERLDVERLETGGLTLKGKDEETQQKLDRVNLAVGRATRTLGFFILGLILLPLVAPPLVRLFLG
jgi:membrane-associated protease RseP (regulator of RpoE activity)